MKAVFCLGFLLAATAANAQTYTTVVNRDHRTDRALVERRDLHDDGQAQRRLSADGQQRLQSDGAVKPLSRVIAGRLR